MYKRVVVLEARDDPAGEPFLVLNGADSRAQWGDLRIRVEMESNLAQQLAQAQVMIYNLSLENSQRLCAGDHEPKSTGDAKEKKEAKKVHITVKAGYEDEVMSDLDLPVLITGYVMNASSKRLLPNFITTLYVLPVTSSFLQMTYEPFSTTETDTLKTVLDKICAAAGFQSAAIQYYLPEEKLQTPMRGQTLVGAPDVYDTLTDLSDAYLFTFALTASGIGFYPRPDDSEKGHSEFNHLMENGEAFLVSPELVKGPPQFSILTLQIALNADARIRPGWVLDVTKLLGDEGGRGDTSLPANGIGDFKSVGKYLFYADDIAKYGILGKYMVSRVAHVIDNYSDDWQTFCVGIVPAAGDTDEKESVQ